MKLDLKLKEALDYQKILINELKKKRRYIKNICDNSNLDKQELNNEVLESLKMSQDLITIKSKLRQANVEHSIDPLVYTLSETKELLITYNNILNLCKDKDKDLEESYKKSITNLRNKISNIEDKLKEKNNEATIEIDFKSDIHAITDNKQIFKTK